MIKRFYNFKLNSDARGSLVAIEALQDIPFEIKRVYYIFGNREDVRRGFHAHKQLQQVLVCVHGSCTILLDNGVEREEIILNNPSQGLFVDRMIWREMYNFTSDAVLLVLASEHYDKEDYIWDYQEFKLLHERGVYVISDKAIVQTEKLGSDVKIMEFAVVRQGVSIGNNVVIHPHVVIEPGVVIGNNVEIFPGAYIGKEPKGPGLARKPSFKPYVKIGDNCSIGPHAVIYYEVDIGDNCLIGDGASIREKCVVGDNCIISRYVTINYNTLIGNNTKIMDLSHITGNCRIGNNVFIAPNVGSANDNAIGTLPYDENKVKGPLVKDGASIGLGAILLPGVAIGENAIVGAGAVVTSDVSDRSLVMGIPARIKS